MSKTRALAAILLIACASKDAAQEQSSHATAVTSMPVAPKMEDEARSQKSVAITDMEVNMPAGVRRAESAPAGYRDGTEDKKEKDGRFALDPGAGEGQAKTRAWFPETFLFEPLIVTDETGTKVVPVTVPDRLTTWRVLALGHTRTGSQGGTVASFLGTLDAYVDPVVPAFLVAGDVIRLPIQLVNTTTTAKSGPLKIEATGATVQAANVTVTVPAEGSVVQYATLSAPRPGRVGLLARFGDTDSVTRSIDVVPGGRPVTVERGGTLAAPRTLTLTGPTGADPASDRVRLLVYPGALAILRSELAVSSARGGVADDAYALLLAGRAPSLLAALSDQADPKALRDLTVVMSQRAVRHGRVLDGVTATLLVEATAAHPENPVLSRLGERAAQDLARRQAPDGTMVGEAGWTLPRVLVGTADAVRAARAAATTPEGQRRAAAMALKASGAFERHLDMVQDPYTAAAILASGAASGDLRAKLKKLIVDSIKTEEGGAKYVELPEGVVRADGQTPSRIEATALAILALASETDVAVADLGATLLGAYRPYGGWGDGRTNLVALQAVVQLFREPLPGSIKITLSVDGKVVGEGSIDKSSIREVLAIEVPSPGNAGAHTWEIKSEPAVPGLGYSLALQSWVPWTAEASRGLELTVDVAADLRVGMAADVTVRAVAPGGVPLVIRQALPAGVQPDTASLEQLVAMGTISSFNTADGSVELHVNALQPAQTFAARYRVIPTLGGSLHASASSLEGAGETVHVPSAAWTIR
jgi:hypothetical protein